MTRVLATFRGRGREALGLAFVLPVLFLGLTMLTVALGGSQ